MTSSAERRRRHRSPTVVAERRRPRPGTASSPAATRATPCAAPGRRRTRRPRARRRSAGTARRARRRPPRHPCRPCGRAGTCGRRPPRPRARTRPARPPIDQAAPGGERRPWRSRASSTSAPGPPAEEPVRRSTPGVARTLAAGCRGRGPGRRAGRSGTSRATRPRERGARRRPCALILAHRRARRPRASTVRRVALDGTRVRLALVGAECQSPATGQTERPMPTYEYRCAKCGEQTRGVPDLRRDAAHQAHRLRRQARQGALAGRHRPQGLGLLQDRQPQLVEAVARRSATRVEQLEARRARRLRRRAPATPSRARARARARGSGVVEAGAPSRVVGLVERLRSQEPRKSA